MGTQAIATLVLILNASATDWWEMPVADLPAEQCAEWAEAIWALPTNEVGTDEHGNAIPAVDAWCKED